MAGRAGGHGISSPEQPGGGGQGGVGHPAGRHAGRRQLEEFWWLGTGNGQDAGLFCTCNMVYGYCRHTIRLIIHIFVMVTILPCGLESKTVALLLV